MRPHTSSDESHRVAFGFSPHDDPDFVTRLRNGLGERGARAPAGQGPSGSSAPGKLRKRSASGHAAANARRMRLVVSTTRAAIFKRRRRSVANSAVASSRALGMAAHGKHQPISGGVEHETDLVGERRTAARAIGGELRLMQLD